MNKAALQIDNHDMNSTSLIKRLASQYHDQLLSFFYRRSQSRWDAEELTQEVFCKIIKRNDIECHENQEAYVFTVAWSVLRDRVRSDKVRHRKNHIAFDEALANSRSIPVERMLDSQQQYQSFLAVIKQLSPKTCEIFLLNRYEGATYSEIADHYAISISAVEKHMMKALTSIRESLRTAL